MKKYFVIGLFFVLFLIVLIKVVKIIKSIRNDLECKKDLIRISEEKNCSMERAIQYQAVNIAAQNIKVDTDKLKYRDIILERDKKVLANTEFGQIEGYFVGVKFDVAHGYEPVIVITDKLKLYSFHLNSLIDGGIVSYED